MQTFLDHLVISTTDLTAGRAWAESLLDVRFGPRGEHVVMGTHNHLIGLDRGAYLEVISTDPQAPAPQRPRWFDLDNFNTTPRLTNWVVNVDNLDEAKQRSPDGAGEVTEFVRGPYAWKMLVPEDGKLPFNGCFPALIEWLSEHPAPQLVNAGLVLRRLKLMHPEAAALEDALSPFAGALENVRIVQTEQAALHAEISSPSGEIWIT